MTPDSNTSCTTMETIQRKVTDEYFDNLILNTINTIRKNRKRPDRSSIHEDLRKELNNSDVTAEIADIRLSFITKKNRIKNKLTNGKVLILLKTKRF